MAEGQLTIGVFAGYTELRSLLMTCRAKFTVQRDTQFGFASSNGPVLQNREISLTATYDDGLSKENKTFAQATPSGSITFTLSNKALDGMFKAGESYYVDFTPADPQV